MIALLLAKTGETLQPDEEGLELHEVEFDDGDLKALRYMLGIFRGAQRFVAGLAKLVGGQAAQTTCTYSS